MAEVDGLTGKCLTVEQGCIMSQFVSKSNKHHKKRCASTLYSDRENRKIEFRLNTIFQSIKILEIGKQCEAHSSKGRSKQTTKKAKCNS